MPFSETFFLSLSLFGYSRNIFTNLFPLHNFMLLNMPQLMCETHSFSPFSSSVICTTQSTTTQTITTTMGQLLPFLQQVDGVRMTQTKNEKGTEKNLTGKLLFLRFSFAYYNVSWSSVINSIRPNWEMFKNTLQPSVGLRIDQNNNKSLATEFILLCFFRRRLLFWYWTKQN